MAKKKRSLKVEKGSSLILAITGLVFLVIATLEKFGVIGLSSQIPSISVILGSGFVFNEQYRKLNGKVFKGAGSIMLTIFMAVAVFSAVFSLLGAPITFLQPIEGFVLAGTTIFFLVELFK